MRITTTAVSALVVGALVGGLGVTPAMAASRTSSPVGSAVSASLAPAQDGSRVSSSRIITATPARPSTTTPAGNARVAPIIIAVAAAFVAAVRAVPGLVRVLKPFATRGATAFWNAVRKHTPKPVVNIVLGAMGSALYDQVKRLFGW